jgi:hypothetical protein
LLLPLRPVGKLTALVVESRHGAPSIVVDAWRHRSLFVVVAAAASTDWEANSGGGGDAHGLTPAVCCGIAALALLCSPTVVVVESQHGPA